LKTTDQYTVDIGQRHAILLALARLAVERPGWDSMLGDIAEQFQGREMFEQCKMMNFEPPPADKFHAFDCTCDSDPLGRCVVHPEAKP
jgi:hypothetical protein